MQISGFVAIFGSLPRFLFYNCRKFSVTRSLVPPLFMDLRVEGWGLRVEGLRVWRLFGLMHLKRQDKTRQDKTRQSQDKMRSDLIRWDKMTIEDRIRWDKARGGPALSPTAAFFLLLTGWSRQNKTKVKRQAKTKQDKTQDKTRQRKTRQDKTRR